MGEEDDMKGALAYQIKLAALLISWIFATDDCLTLANPFPDLGEIIQFYEGYSLTLCDCFAVTLAEVELAMRFHLKQRRT